MDKKVFNFTKEYSDLYLPKGKPVLVDVPAMNFIMVDGQGDPNNNPQYQTAISLLYGFTFTIKMSKMKGNQPDGYFEYVVPPLEGLWWIDNGKFSLDQRDNWKWTAMIRQPEFVDDNVFNWAAGELKKKKPELPLELARFETFKEGLCVQVMHKGPYTDEPETMKKIDLFIQQEGLKDEVVIRKHHEIYLVNPQRAKLENLKTVLRHPVSKV